MSTRGGRDRVYPQALRVAAVERMEAAENITAVSRGLGAQRELLYLWRGKYRTEGPAGLRDRGRPRRPTPGAEPSRRDGADPAARIAELEHKVGQQALELDFFRAALKQFGRPHPAEDEASETGSTP